VKTKNKKRLYVYSAQGKAAAMRRIKFIKCCGEKVLKLDFSRLVDEQEEIKLIEGAKKTIKKQPEKSLLILTDVTGSKYTKNVASELTDFIKHNTPYTKAGAVLGVSGITLLLFKAIVKHSGRKNMKAFTDEKKAKEWLLAHSGRKKKETAKAAKKKVIKPRKKAKKKIRPAVR